MKTSGFLAIQAVLRSDVNDDGVTAVSAPHRGVGVVLGFLIIRGAGARACCD